MSRGRADSYRLRADLFSRGVAGGSRSPGPGQGLKKSFPDHAVETGLSHGGEPDEFDAECAVSDPSNPPQINGEGRRCGENDGQAHVAAREHGPIRGDRAAGCREVADRTFTHERCAAENDGVGDGKTLRGTRLIGVMHGMIRDLPAIR